MLDPINDRNHFLMDCLPVPQDGDMTQGGCEKWNEANEARLEV